MQMKKTNINDTQYNYAELDLALLCEEKYKELKPIDILTFTMLKNQESLSLESVKRGNKSFVDKDGNLFVMISQKKLSKIVRVSERTLRDILKRLEKNDLILVEQIGQNKCNKMYIGEPERKTTLGEYIEKIGLEIIEENKNKENIIKFKSEKLAKIGNKKVASTPHTSNLDESSTDSNCSNNNNSVPQIQESIQHENITLLKESGIKFIPYKKENHKIISMNTDKLKQSIDITIEKAEKPNFNYLITTYESLNKEVDNKYFKNDNKFRNFTETFDQYSEYELNNIIEKSQMAKFK